MKFKEEHYELVKLGLKGLIKKHDLGTISRVFNHHLKSYGSVGATLALYSEIRLFIDKGLEVQAIKDGIDPSVLKVDLHDAFQRVGYHDTHIDTAVRKMVKELDIV